MNHRKIDIDRFGAEIRIALSDFAKTKAEQEKHKSDNETTIRLRKIEADKEIRVDKIKASQVVAEEREVDKHHRNIVILIAGLSLAAVVWFAGINDFAAIAIIASLAMALVSHL